MEDVCGELKGIVVVAIISSTISSNRLMLLAAAIVFNRSLVFSLLTGTTVYLYCTMHNIWSVETQLH